MTNNTERPDFPLDGMTSDERRAAALFPPKPARTTPPRVSPYNDGEPVTVTWGNVFAMLGGAAAVVAVCVGLYLELSWLA